MPLAAQPPIWIFLEDRGAGGTSRCKRLSQRRGIMGRTVRTAAEEAAVIETVRLFDDTATTLLKQLIGRARLHAYEAYIMVEGPDHIYKTLRLEFEGGPNLLLRNAHQSIPLGAGGQEEEVAVLTLEQDDGRTLWHPRGKHSTRKVGVDLFPDDIYLVVDTAQLCKGRIPVNKLKLVQAVVFWEAGRLLAIDRDVWFDEYLTLREGASLDSLVRDASGDWHEDPPLGYRFTRDVLSLAMGGVRV